MSNNILTKLSRNCKHYSYLGILEYSIPLEMATYLVKEESLIVWLAALSHLSTWVELLQETSGRKTLNKFILSLLDPMYKKLKWEDTGDHVDRYKHRMRCSL